MKTWLRVMACAFSAFIVMPGCGSIDDDRIPVMPVYVPFQTQADWTVYGVGGATSSKMFIKSERVPSGYPWQAATETGFGGILLVSDIMGEPQAYDLACPVERDPNVRIMVDDKILKAECQKCGSIYEIFTNYGHPVSGPAAEHGYGLQRYRVGPGAMGQFMIITR